MPLKATTINHNRDNTAHRKNGRWNLSAGRKGNRLNSHVSCKVRNTKFKSLTRLKCHQNNQHDGLQWKCKKSEVAMKFSRSDLGQYTHLCDKKLLRKTPLPFPGVNVADDFS